MISRSYFAKMSLGLILIPLLLTLNGFGEEKKSPSNKKETPKGNENTGDLDESKLPPPANGFKWIILPEINAAFQMPTDWHFLREEQDGQLGYFFSLENIETDTDYKTGLSVNVVMNVKEKVGKDAVRYARDVIVEMVKNSDTLSTGTDKVSTLSQYMCRSRIRGEDGSSIIVHNLTIGNSVTDTFYMIIFESPESKWKEAEKVAKIMLTDFALDDEI